MSDGLRTADAQGGDEYLLKKLRWLRDTVGVDIELMFARAQKEKDGREPRRTEGQPERLPPEALEAMAEFRDWQAQRRERACAQETVQVREPSSEDPRKADETVRADLPNACANPCQCKEPTEFRAVGGGLEARFCVTCNVRFESRARAAPTPSDHRCTWDGCQNDRIDLSGYCAEHPPVEKSGPSSRADGPPLAAHGIDIIECTVNEIVAWARKCAANNQSLADGSSDAYVRANAGRDARAMGWVADQIEARAWVTQKGRPGQP